MKPVTAQMKEPARGFCGQPDGFHHALSSEDLGLLLAALAGFLLLLAGFRLVSALLLATLSALPTLLLAGLLVALILLGIIHFKYLIGLESNPTSNYDRPTYNPQIKI
jgi:hypothetical protein